MPFLIPPTIRTSNAQVGNFSASDLRLFGYDDGVSKLASEGRTLKEFYNQITPPSDDLGYPVTVLMSSTTEVSLSIHVISLTYRKSLPRWTMHTFTGSTLLIKKKNLLASSLLLILFNCSSVT